MNATFFMGVFWTLYGIAGLFGWILINPNFKGYPWTKKYKRCLGVSWLMLGIPCLVFGSVVFMRRDIGFGVLWFLVCCMPALVYTIVIERKYKAMLEK